ncbi:MAG: heavy metal-responsive transcriptional regulator [Cyanobacteria bacterium P01_A01_bin.84]
MLTKDDNLLLIGEVKAKSGVSIKTIRYYESLGLVQSKSRTNGGFRQFSPEILTRLSFIKRAKGLGLSLQEIGDILKIYDNGNSACDDIQHKLEDKIDTINQQIEDLLKLREELQQLLSTWHSLSKKPEEIICPNIQQNMSLR